MTALPTRPCKWNGSPLKSTRFHEFPLEFIIVATVSLLLLPLTGCGSKKKVEYGPKNDQFASRDSVETAKRSKMLSAGLDGSLKRAVNWNPIVDREVRRLSAYINDSIRQEASRSDFTAASLSYAGIDLADADSTHTGEQVAVKRWRRGTEPAALVGDGLNQLIDNHYGDWKSAQSFRTELEAHDITLEDDTLYVTVLAKSFGKIDDSTNLETTSLWKTQWRIIPDESAEIDLTEIQVDAYEETRLNASTRRLFKDVTQVALKDQPCLPQQLNHGIDDWATRIAGINIMGNHGFAVGDPNGDGLEDIYFCQPHGLPNLMLFQTSEGSIIETGDQTGTNLLDDSRAALFVDLDNDGDEDLVISTSRELILMANAGNGDFRLEHRLLAGFDAGSLSAADYDNDGDLDLYVCKYRSLGTENDLFPHPNSYGDASNGRPNVLLQNNEGWNFEDVTHSVGLGQDNNRFTRGAVWCDYDNDGDQDLFVVNEFSRNQYYDNVGGKFTPTKNSDKWAASSSASSASVGDFNADGNFDIFVASQGVREARQLKKQLATGSSNFQSSLVDSLSGDNYVLHSTPNSERNFSSYRLPAPVYDARFSAGTTNIDLNNDGFEDVILTHGLFSRNRSASDCILESHWLQHAFSGQQFSVVSAQSDADRFASITRLLADELREGESFGEQQRNVCLIGMGTPGFANFSALAGLDFPDDARAVGTLDWDHDGDLDVVLSARTAPRFRLLINQLQSENNHLSFHLVGTKSNRDAIGAKVELFVSGRDAPIVQYVSAGSGTLSQSSKRLHFGIPKGKEITEAIVHWPSGESQTFTNLRPRSRYQIVEGRDRLIQQPRRRFRLDLTNDGSQIAIDKMPPRRSVFLAPFGLPNLEFQGEDKNWFRLGNIDRMPVFVAFVDGSAASTRLMESISREAREFSSMKVDVIAVRIDGDAPDSVDHFESMQNLANKTEFPFRYGAASQSMIDKIRRLHGEWFSFQAIPRAPFGWLIDRDGEVRVVYHSSDIRPTQVTRDVTDIDGGLKQTAKRVSPFKGRWIGSTPATDYERIATRFEELGYAKDVKIFSQFNRHNQAGQECRRAIQLAAIGDWTGADQAFQGALELEAECGLTCSAYGEFLLQQFEKTKELETQRSLLQKAEELFERSLRLEPSSARAVLGRAAIAKHRNQVDDAIALLKRHIKINPTQWEVHATLGRLYFEKRKYVEATSHLKTAFKKRPTLPFVAGDLGFLHLHGGLFKEARFYLQSACQLQPSSTRMCEQLAHVEFLTGHHQQSIELLRELKEEANDDVLQRSLLAWQLATCENEELRNGEESVEIATTLVEEFGDSAASYEVCAAAYAEKGDFKQALELQQKASDLIRTGTSSNSYSESQKEGMLSRLQLYRWKQPCRSTETDNIPIRQPGT